MKLQCPIFDAMHAMQQMTHTYITRQLISCCHRAICYVDIAKTGSGGILAQACRFWNLDATILFAWLSFLQLL